MNGTFQTNFLWTPSFSPTKYEFVFTKSEKIGSTRHAACAVSSSISKLFIHVAVAGGATSSSEKQQRQKHTTEETDDGTDHFDVDDLNLKSQPDPEAVVLSKDSPEREGTAQTPLYRSLIQELKTDLQEGWILEEWSKQIAKTHETV